MGPTGNRRTIIAQHSIPSSCENTPGEAQAVHDRGLFAGEIQIQGRGDLEALSEGEAVFRTDCPPPANSVHLSEDSKPHTVKMLP